MGKESNFEVLQKQLFETKIEEEKMNNEIQDLFKIHDELFAQTNPNSNHRARKQKQYNWRDNKKSFTLQKGRKKIFSIPKKPQESDTECLQ